MEVALVPFTHGTVKNFAGTTVDLAVACRSSACGVDRHMHGLGKLNAILADGWNGMKCYAIRAVEESNEKSCAQCGKTFRGNSTLALFAEDNDHPVCRNCARKLAPAMSALLDLAQTAQRIGRGSRHLLTPPMESLLDLAHAAETYSTSAAR